MCQWGKRQCEIPEHTGESSSTTLHQWPGMYSQQFLSIKNLKLLEFLVLNKVLPLSQTVFLLMNWC